MRREQAYALGRRAAILKLAFQASEAPPLTPEQNEHIRRQAELFLGNRGAVPGKARPQTLLISPSGVKRVPYPLRSGVKIGSSVLKTPASSASKAKDSSVSASDVGRKTTGATSTTTSMPVLDTKARVLGDATQQRTPQTGGQVGTTSNPVAPLGTTPVVRAPQLTAPQVPAIASAQGVQQAVAAGSSAAVGVPPARGNAVPGAVAPQPGVGR